ncbi:MAG TPA: cupin domain-containing protein [Candidatus Methanofastidiosa archaeon]|nr:cupin domain-containing protein [Candidatus Methanofastidiosa archaeon]
MFKKEDELRTKELLKGISMELLCHGDKALMARFLLRGGHELPMHSHPYEQVGYMVSGHMVLVIDGTDHDVLEGDSWCIPQDVEHGAHILEDSLVVEVFSPPRDDYLALEE